MGQIGEGGVRQQEDYGADKEYHFFDVVIYLNSEVLWICLYVRYQICIRSLLILETNMMLERFSEES